MAVTGRPSLNQWRLATLPSAIATKLASRASEASRVVTTRIECPVAGPKADRQQPALRVEQEAEFHGFGQLARRGFERPQALVQCRFALVRVGDVEPPALDATMYRIGPIQQVGIAGVGAFAGQRARDVRQRAGLRGDVRQARRSVAVSAQGVLQRGGAAGELFVDLAPHDGLRSLLNRQLAQRLLRQ